MAKELESAYGDQWPVAVEPLKIGRVDADPFTIPCKHCGQLCDEYGNEKPDQFSLGLEPHSCMTPTKWVVVALCLVGLAWIIWSEL